MRRARTIARIAAVYLLLGFVTTWAVAWGLALPPPADYKARDARTKAISSTLHRGVVGEIYRSFGGMRTGFSIKEQDVPFTTAGEPIYEWASYYDVFVDSTPSSAWVVSWNLAGFDGWGMRREAMASGRSGSWSVGVDDGLGFPAIALWCSWEAHVAGGHFVIDRDKPPHGGIRIRDTAAGSFGVTTPRALPYYPIWSGLALNTVFYALLFFAVARTLRAFRRSRRHARGLCPRCKYDRQFDYRLPCPECGDSPRAGRLRPESAAALTS